MRNGKFWSCMMDDLMKDWNCSEMSPDWVIAVLACGVVRFFTQCPSVLHVGQCLRVRGDGKMRIPCITHFSLEAAELSCQVKAFYSGRHDWEVAKGHVAAGRCPCPWGQNMIGCRWWWGGGQDRCPSTFIHHSSSPGVAHAFRWDD